MPYPPVRMLAGWAGGPPQVFPAAPPMPNCIGPAAPALLAPEWRPGAPERPESVTDWRISTVMVIDPGVRSRIRSAVTVPAVTAADCQGAARARAAVSWG